MTSNIRTSISSAAPLAGLQHAVMRPEAVKYAVEQFCRQLKEAEGNLLHEMERAVEGASRVEPVNHSRRGWWALHVLD